MDESFRRLAAFLTTVLVTALALGHGSRAVAQNEHTAVSDHFSFTWTDEDVGDATLVDDDGNSVPDGVDKTLAAFEAAYEFEIDRMGYQAPPGERPYRIYASSHAEARVLPGPDRSRPSFILFPLTAVGRPRALHALAAHEFHHAIQFGYDSDEDPWVREATSTWIENIFVGKTTRGARTALTFFVPRPGESLFSTDGVSEYGAFLFLQFLTERYGDATDPAAIVRELWEEMAVPEAVPGAPNHDSTAAVAAVLARRDTTWQDAWAEFQLWRWRLGHFENGAIYRKALAGSWPLPAKELRVRTESCRLTTRELPAMSGEYVRMNLVAAEPGVNTMLVTARGPADSRGFLQTKSVGRPVITEPLQFEDAGIARSEVRFSPGERPVVTLGLTNTEPVEAPVAFSARNVDVPSRVTVAPPSGPPATSYGVGVRLHGEVTCKGRPAPHAELLIRQEEIVSGVVSDFPARTSDEGRWAVLIEPASSSRYTVQVVDPLLSVAASSMHAVGVRVFVTVTLSAGELSEGEALEVSGDVSPPHPEAKLAVKFRRPEGIWRLGKETSLTLEGRYSTEIVLPREGVWEVRARVISTGDLDHQPGTSVIELVDVQDTH